MTLFINPLRTSLLFTYVGELLTDKHINFVQKLVGSKFKNIYGLQSTLTLHKTTRVPVKCAKVFYKLFTPGLAIGLLHPQYSAIQ